MAKKSKRVTHCDISTTAKGIAILLPKTDYFTPVYSREQVRQIVADLQSALDDDMFLA